VAALVVAVLIKTLGVLQMEQLVVEILLQHLQVKEIMAAL
jgi:hypothetical protein